LGCCSAAVHPSLPLHTTAARAWWCLITAFRSPLPAAAHPHLPCSSLPAHARLTSPIRLLPIALICSRSPDLLLRDLTCPGSPSFAPAHPHLLLTCRVVWAYLRLFTLVWTCARSRSFALWARSCGVSCPRSRSWVRGYLRSFTLVWTCARSRHVTR